MTAIKVLGAVGAFAALAAFSGQAAAQVNVQRIAMPQANIVVAAPTVRPPPIPTGIRRTPIKPPSRGRGR